MANYLKIILSILALSLVFILFSTVIKSCGNKSEGIENVSNTDESENTGTLDVSEELFEDEITDDDFESGSDENEIKYDEIDQALSEKEMAKSKPANSKPKADKVESFEDDDSFESTPSERQTATPQASTSYGNASGRFLVITGSYLIKSNAENMVRDLNGLGYNSAEIVVFDNSQYNSVIAARYDNYESAVDASSNLKRKGIDSYVHRKK